MRQSSSRYKAHGKLRERERCWKVRGFFNSILHARVCQGKSLNKGFHREKKDKTKQVIPRMNWQFSHYFVSRALLALFNHINIKIFLELIMDFQEIQKAPSLIYSSFTEILASNTEKKSKILSSVTYIKQEGFEQRFECALSIIPSDCFCCIGGTGFSKRTVSFSNQTSC